MNKLLKELKQLEKKVASANSTHNSQDHHYTTVFFLIALATTALAVLIWFGPEITGFVTFSESVVSVESESFMITESGKHIITTDLDNINSVLLSGKVTGSGKAAVFLQGKDKNYLAYYFEGNTEQGIQFKDMCYDTCHLQDLSGENTLWFELEGTRIQIDNIKYMYNRLIDFDLQPRTIGIDYKKNPASIINIRLTNKELTDYKVLLYIDGPLSSSFSWQGSLIHMNKNNSEKTIPITVKLPSNLQEGEYAHKLTARYIPPDTHDFIGESPIAESFITIYN